MKTFEDYLVFIEDELGLQLLDYQKEMLRNVYKNKYCYYLPYSKYSQILFIKAMILLLQEIIKENNYEH